MADTEALRLLQVLEPSGGGSGRHFIDLCGGLTRAGHQVTAVYSPLRAETRFIEELYGLGLYRVVPLAMRRAVGPWDAKDLMGLRQIIRQHGAFDLIHGHSSKAGALTRLGRGFGNAPVVYTPHAFRTMDPALGRNGHRLYGTVERMLGRFLSDRIICVSQDEFHHAASLGIPPEKLRIVVNGVAYPPSENRSALRARLGLDKNDFLFGFVGRLVAQKAPERLIEAFAEVKAAMPNAHLLMIGQGEMETNLRSLIARKGLEKTVRLQSDMAGHDAMQAFDALVAPSRYEAMSYVMLEAAAAGLPLILTQVGGASTVLEHDVNGCLVANSDDPGPLSRAMLRLADPLIRARLTAGALSRRHGYRLETMVQETLTVYGELLPGRVVRKRVEETDTLPGHPVMKQAVGL
ncbi:glycosyltransferase family 4 protein [Rhizobium paknamense]|uniref:Glycosyltransferase involved in cell wall biosynthesis n=1 Tax=Rhizobium paknamense TaxID=1206817 RepID=A0ABU0I771_9HYPH|nr:glycosyltransferase family 4 protein [Rhizobium paknamense]MDQ0454061.1 glycosyltransferase involved in cell wall biosynthesis [Rhizobium paknamense]